ncbi:MAG: sigma-54-dependent Fis family transcriptional regulator [Peptococcaceae bacterium]|nr:sigma-54-dependent Fis family transcriptional regulator [Peptococcaceae bacterium]
MKTAIPVKDKNYLQKETWDNYIKKGIILDPNIRPHILRSWERCKGIDPDINPIKTDQVLNSFLLEEKRQSYRDLVSVSEPILDELCNLGGQFFVLLSAPDGYTLYVKSNVDYPFLPLGAKCSEEHIGTNAIGIALVENDHIEVNGYEHYSSHLHTSSCFAIPIRDLDNKIVGVVCISNPFGQLTPCDKNLMKLGAQIIENKYNLFREKNNRTYIDSILNLFMDSVEQYALVLDNNGIIVNANEKFLNLMKADFKEDITGLPYHKIIEDKNRCLTGLKNSNMELELITKNQKIKCQVKKHSTKNNSNTILFLEPIRTNKIVSISNTNLKSNDNANSESNNTANFISNQIIGESKKWLNVIERSLKAAQVNSSILIEGESGTGKELISQVIHSASKRKGPFVPINCGSIPEGLVESELFGYEEGAFTGAKRGGMIGKLQMADKGTLFLDEIGEMPLEMQVNLLRFLQDKTIIRIGSNKPRTVNVRIIAATNRNLRQEVKKGRFREDLFYRLNVINIKLPPLRERKEDIPLLTHYYVQKICQQMNKPSLKISKAVMKILTKYDWPGNVRELINVIENAVVFTEDNEITVDVLPSYLGENINSTTSYHGNLKQQEQAIILNTLEKNDWNISKSARELGISRNTLYKRIKDINRIS